MIVVDEQREERQECRKRAKKTGESQQKNGNIVKRGEIHIKADGSLPSGAPSPLCKTRKIY